MTDNSVETLSKLKSLARLNIVSCGLTDEGIEKLRVALPNCDIVEDDDYEKFTWRVDSPFYKDVAVE